MPAALALVLAAAPAARANTYFANRLSDTAPNGCTANACTLREAAIRANSHSGPDTILLRSGETYKLAITGFGEGQAATGDIDLRGRTTVQANGFKHATVDGQQIDRVFDTFAPAVLSRLTIRNGKAPGLPAPNSYGGGVRSADALKVSRSTVTGNTGAEGAGISSTGAADVALSRSLVTNNPGIGLAQIGKGSVLLLRTEVASNLDGGAEDRLGGSVTMSGGSAAGNGGHGVLETGPGSVRASGVHADGNYGDGLREFGSGNLSVSGGTAIFGASAGLTEWGAGNLRVVGTTVRRNGGVVERGRGNALVSRSLVKGNGAVGSGIAEMDAGNLTVGRTRVSDTQSTGIAEHQGGDLAVSRSRISGAGVDGVDELDPGKLTLSRSTVTGSAQNGVYEQGDGSAIVSRSVLEDNGSGGLAAFGAGRLVARRLSVRKNQIAGIQAFETGGSEIALSLISGNKNPGDPGAGVQIGGGPATIDRSTIRGNSSSYAGGGIWIGDVFGPTSLDLTRSTVSGNTADGNGAGIEVNGAGATLRAVNSTVTKNAAKDNGGGIAADNGSEVHLNGVTVARNTADSDGLAPNGFGGGLFQEAGSAISSKNSLIALNLVNFPGAIGEDCYGSADFASGGHNLRSHANGCTGFNGAGDIIRDNPKLALLADNGGPTRTIALKPGSPAINRGGSSAPAHDQRGVAAQGKRDIGAFEFVP